MYEEGRTVISKNPLLKEKKESVSLAYLVEIKGNDIGFSLPLKKDSMIIGRSPDSDLMLLSDSISRKHMIITKKGESNYFLEDNQSTNGIYVNNIRVQSLALRDGDIINVGDFGFKFLNENNPEAKYHQELYNLKNFDSLTKAYNKSYFEARLRQELERVNRYNKELSFIILDIDFFKQYNDTYGHQAGDTTLKRVAKQLKDQLQRASDYAFRLGGEEFGVIFSGLDFDHSYHLANQIRESIESLSIEHKNSKASKVVTVSVGLAIIDPNDSKSSTNPDLIYKTADEALYMAKKEGRNRVKIIH